MQVKPLSTKCVTYFDCIRFFLAQIVVIGHGFGFYFGYWNGFFPSKAPYIQSIAVVGFFFVSGFLICRSVLANIEYKGRDTARYFIDRAARIYTTLVPCLLFVWLVDYACSLTLQNSTYGDSLTLGTFLKNLSLIPSMPLGTMRPIWSLMFEWWLYVLFGGIIFFRKTPIFAGICICLGAYYTFRVNAKGEAGHLELIWFLGAASAFLLEKMPTASSARYKLIGFAVLLASSVVYLKTLNAYNLWAGSLFSIGLLLLAMGYNADNSPSPPKTAHTFSLLAGYSFTLFLTHYTVLYWIQKSGYTGVQGFAISFIASNIIAYAIAYNTERHHKVIAHHWLNAINRWKSTRVRH